MTQQVLPAATAVLGADAAVGEALRATAPAAAAPASPTAPAASSLDKACSPAKSLAEQVQERMDKLLAVSSQFKDLTGQDRAVSTREETIAMMQSYLERLGLARAVNEQLSVVHVAGTKGKGSTCAMVERILRAAGYRTGLFTSPHLVSPCERVRLDGRPLPESLFLEHFDAVWTGLERSAADCGPYPPMAWFFRFLTLLALRVFAHERVDVVILEVGIGGRLDATNVVPRPAVCGISTLDLDHVQVLGDSLAQIAHAKGGILKRAVPAFTVHQDPEALDALRKCAADTGANLTVVPPIDALGPGGDSAELGMRGDFQRVNAGLAAALAATWLRQRRARDRGDVDIDAIIAEPLDLSNVLEPAVLTGLKCAFWPARAHELKAPALHLSAFIDGAHTLRSLEAAAQWFAGAAPAASRRALVFTIHHERNVAAVVAPLLALPFERVYFVKTRAARPSRAKVLAFSEALAAAGHGAVADRYAPDELAALDAVDGPLQWQHTLARLWRALKTHLANDPPAFVEVRASVADVLQELAAAAEDARADGDAREWSVLTTGSLYLAGEALEYLGWSE